MIRKNQVEGILVERDILISIRNPFVVSRPYHVVPYYICEVDAHC
jgi:hypothetical protein